MATRPRPRRPWHSGYNFSKRMQPHQGTPLRPLLDADDDLWLDAARQLYPVLSRAKAGVEDNCHSIHPGFCPITVQQQSNICLDICLFCFSFLILLQFYCQVHKQKAMAVTLETIDRNAFTVSRAHLGGWSLPGLRDRRMG